VKGREPAWIHPADAAARGIVEGEIIRLFNGRGACLAGAVVTDKVMPGVVQLATGAWFSPMPDPAGAAGRGNSVPMCTHGNPNVLTRDAGTSRIAQGSSAQTCLVEAEPWDGQAPPVQVMEPPAVETP
jgi:biotin/methionine sulfoxide reductase